MFRVVANKEPSTVPASGTPARDANEIPLALSTKLSTLPSRPAGYITPAQR